MTRSGGADEHDASPLPDPSQPANHSKDEEIRAARADEANIRWLLAAVLHHQPEAGDAED